VAIFSLVYMGSFALGSALWGGVAQRRGIGLALIYSGFGTVGSVMLALFARLPDSTADLTPWNHWRMPVIVKEVGAEFLEGPVLVTIEYSVVLGREAEFIEAIRKYPGRGVAMVRISGESIATPKWPIGLSKYS
jgi:Transmembrane secretion effector